MPTFTFHTEGDILLPLIERVIEATETVTTIDTAREEFTIVALTARVSEIDARIAGGIAQIDTYKAKKVALQQLIADASLALNIPPIVP